MTARELLATLQAEGVRVSAKGDRLVLDSPKGVLDAERLEQVRVLKPELLALLAESGIEPGAEPPPAPANEDVSFLELLEAADRFQREGKPGPWGAFTMSAEDLDGVIGDLPFELRDDLDLRIGIYRRDGLPDDHARRIALFLLADEHDVPLGRT